MRSITLRADSIPADLMADPHLLQTWLCRLLHGDCTTRGSAITRQPRSSYHWRLNRLARMEHVHLNVGQVFVNVNIGDQPTCEVVPVSKLDKIGGGGDDPDCVTTTAGGELLVDAWVVAGDVVIGDPTANEDQDFRTLDKVLDQQVIENTDVPEPETFEIGQAVGQPETSAPPPCSPPSTPPSLFPLLLPPSLTPTQEPQPSEMPKTAGGVKRGKPNTGPCEGRGVVIPRVLDTPRFRDLWAQFLSNRERRRLPMTAYAAGLSLRRMADWGLDTALLALEAAVIGNWQGIHLPKTGEIRRAEETRQFDPATFVDEEAGLVATHPVSIAEADAFRDELRRIEAARQKAGSAA